ncbi:MAG: acylphosphatase [Calditrichaeota bacterium]|nr:MAG: acylphosphatase [Calditrichota bacterium]
MEKSSILAYVHGMVQGVGFRFFTHRTASALGLSGYVKNLPDGRVEVVAEGPRDKLEELVQRLKEGPGGGEVEDVQVEWKSYKNRFDGFSIERSIF